MSIQKNKKIFRKKKYLSDVFTKDQNIIIGAIHFPPLIGYKDSPGLEVAEKNALQDLKALEEGGVDAIVFENNYDTPHKIFIAPETAKEMTYLGEKIKNSSKLPVGISVLWNDYKTALQIAKKLNLQFIRVPVFVDVAKTNYGTVIGEAEKVIKYRKKIKAKEVAIFTDIHVKHSEIISTHTIEESTALAIEKGSDALIITGKWTGDEPDLEDLKKIRKKAPNFPILIGSGVDKDNIKKIFKYANGAIVSTSLKEGSINREEINLKGWGQRISTKKVIKLISKL